MPATTQEKQDYVNVINAIWGVGIIPQNTIDNINDDVIEKVDVALTSIRECSKAMIGIDAVFSIFYGTTYSSWKALLAAAREEVSKTGADWIDVLLGSSRYKICVNTAKAANRTHVQNALIEASMM